MKDILLVKVLPNCTQSDLHLRHGSILASGQIINAICRVAVQENIPILQYFGASLTDFSNRRFEIDCNWIDYFVLQIHRGAP